MECRHIPAAEIWDSFSDQQIREFRNHLRSCLACRRRILASAPDLLLDELQSEPMPEEFWLGFWDSLERRLPDRAPRERNRLPLMPVARWAAVCAVTALLVLFSQHLSESPSSPRGGRSARPTTSYSSPSSLVPQPDSSSAYPLIEEVQNPKATYYIIQAANDQKIVMMFDPDMDL
jgi:hypothetical protein